MNRNPRQSLTVRNRTNYFDPDTDRISVRFASPNSYQFRRQKIEGYETRLYWEYRYCNEHYGKTFFFTLTYNDAHIPTYEGQPCFDYEHLVYLLNGAFKKRLLRNFGYNFKYFVSAELGEGKGKRGFENNPHYHVLFFLRPSNDIKYPLKGINSFQFRNLLRTYWQGFDESVDGWHDYKKAKFGIVKEGKYGAEVTHQKALSYCAKYVLKDVRLKRHEDNIRDILYDRYLKEYDSSDFERFAKVENRVELAIKEYRNRYCNKCRISHGVGDYALDFIDDKMNPMFLYPDSKKGWKNRPLSLYYYRKLYTDVCKDAIGNNIYILNDVGFEYKRLHINDSINKLSDKTESLIYVLTPKLFTDAMNSDVNHGCHLTYSYFMQHLDDVKLISKRYAQYKLVYEDRFFKVHYSELDLSHVFPSVDVDSDFIRFIYPSYFTTDYNSDRLASFLENDCEGYFSYDSHPYFLRYIGVFRVLDIVTDYLFVQSDRKAEDEANEVRRVQQFHNRLALKQYYNSKINCYVH